MSVGKLKICDTKDMKSEELKYCINTLMLDRAVDQKKDYKEKQGGGQGRGGNRQRGGNDNYNKVGKSKTYNSYYNQENFDKDIQDDNDFKKGTAKPI